MPRMNNPHQALLTESEAQRALYIDFEGNANFPPTLLGVLAANGSGLCNFFQDVVEAAFSDCAVAHSHEIGEGNYCRTGSLTHVIDTLVDRAREEDRLIVAWSGHEWDVVREYSGVSPRSLSEFDRRFRSAIPTAKDYKRRCFQSHVFPPKPKKGFVPWGTHTLPNYLRMVGYPIPSGSGPGLTGKNLAYLRAELERKGGEHAALTPASKGKWSRVLSHNLHDCCGMRELMLRAAEAYPLGEPEPCGPCGVMGYQPTCPEATR